MNIKPDDLVLEIGSGHNPKPRSDVLCDKLPDDDTERGGGILIDRPFVAADGQHLPFADKSFDYIISCQVLEHAEDPELFISELVRVGKGGYIETPTEIGEMLYGWEYHKWIFNLEPSGKLLIKKKENESQFGQLFHHLYATDPVYAKFHTKNHGLFLIQFEWLNNINYEIVPPETRLLNLNNMDEVRRIAGSQQGKIAISNLAPPWLRRMAKKVAARGYRRNKVDLRSIVVCPLCKSQVTWSDTSITCANCNKIYPIKDGIPYLTSVRCN